MDRLRPVLVAALGFALSLAPVTARQAVSHPWPGITYIERTLEQPHVARMHIVQVDLAQPGIRLKLSAPRGTREVTRQTTLDFLKEQGAQLAVNVHFFWPFPSPEQD